MSHIGQDSWVAHVLNFKRDGLFLDFGGFDGVMHSNTFYLEKALGWRGILVEPNPVPYVTACACRSCITVNMALYPESRRSLEFTNSHGLSSLIDYQDKDSNRELRKQISEGILKVDTINPTELLDRFKMPATIDYLSLDVEGAEHIVITAIDLEKYKIALMSIEHNGDLEKQKAIRTHLSAYGYSVVEHRNDDLFYNLEILSAVTGGNHSDPVAMQEEVFNNYQIITF
jgi:FkbM family methyltransferase